MPGLQAVVSGAILSDYQRLRVEAVAASLGLVSLAPLWRRNQASLLREMAAGGLAAVLVKVAALGLAPEEHLGAALADVTPHLCALERRFGCHAAGEGGEFETLTLDAPFFTAGRLVLDETRVVKEDGASGVGHLQVLQWHVEPKGTEMPQAVMWRADGAPPLPPQAPAPPSHLDVAEAEKAASLDVSRGSTAWQLSSQPFAGACGGQAGPQLRACMTCVGGALADAGLKWSDALIVTLLLRDMADFGAANAAYIAVVPQAAPPARACVGAPLPAGITCALHVLSRSPGAVQAVSSQQARTSLHVQSISAWAPACIGPYSQGVRADGLVHLAGCLGLDPSAMTLAAPAGSPCATAEAAAAAVAATAVAAVLSAPLRRAAAAATLFATSPEAMAALRTAWQACLCGAQPYRRGFEPDGQPETVPEDVSEPVSEDAWASDWQPLLTCLLVPALPRGALCELQPLCFAIADDPVPCGSDDAVWQPGRSLRAHATGTPAAALAQLGAALERAELSWAAVASLRLFVCPGSDDAALRAAWTAALAGVAAGLVPACVPVLGWGSDAGNLAQEGALAELTAWQVCD